MGMGVGVGALVFTRRDSMLCKHRRNARRPREQAGAELAVRFLNQHSVVNLGHYSGRSNGRRS